MREHVTDRSDRQVLVAVALLGLLLAGLGLAAALDLVSLRALLADLEIWRLLRLAERTHAVLSHREAQGLELAAGLAGLEVLITAAWRLLRQP